MRRLSLFVVALCASAFLIPSVGAPQQKESKAAVTVPEEVRRLNTEAKQYHDSGQFDKVIELLTKAVQLAPQYADAYNNLAAAHAAKGQGDTALSFARKAIAMDPDKGAYHTTAGLAYYKLGNLDQAIVAFNKAIALGVRPRIDLLVSQLRC